MPETGDILASRSFSLDDQRSFAEVSGDVNPLHIDPLAARRLMFGAPVVHGVHLVLWAVDRFLAAGGGLSPRRFSVSFPKPCFLNEPVEVAVRSLAETTARLRATVDGTPVAEVMLELGGSDSPRPGGERRPSIAVPKPRDNSFDDLEGLEGELDVPADGGALAASFPELCRAVGDDVVAQLASLSRLVGMESPGLHSLFAGFDVRLTPEGSPSRLHWSVTSADERFSAVTMVVAEGLLEGTVRAFVRPRPWEQAGATALAQLVEPHEFASTTALVVGGSRGLGELTAKLVAAGGGEAIITWHRGADDAAAVVEDIISGGGRAFALQMDADGPAPAFARLRERGVVPTHLFYYASPHIFARRTKLFDSALFESFLRTYVTGFVHAVEGCREIGAATLSAFYPSTVAVNERSRELSEYSAAKAAGESVAHTLGATEDWLDVVVRRLPRLPTDQTATLVEVETADPGFVILEVVRAAHAAIA